jgi:hypothetical protein
MAGFRYSNHLRGCFNVLPGNGFSHPTKPVPASSRFKLTHYQNNRACHKRWQKHSLIPMDLAEGRLPVPAFFHTFLPVFFNQPLMRRRHAG